MSSLVTPTAFTSHLKCSGLFSRTLIFYDFGWIFWCSQESKCPNVQVSECSSVQVDKCPMVWNTVLQGAQLENQRFLATIWSQSVKSWEKWLLEIEFYKLLCQMTFLVTANASARLPTYPGLIPIALIFQGFWLISGVPWKRVLRISSPSARGTSPSEESASHPLPLPEVVPQVDPEISMNNQRQTVDMVTAEVTRRASLLGSCLYACVCKAFLLILSISIVLKTYGRWWQGYSQYWPWARPVPWGKLRQCNPKPQMFQAKATPDTTVWVLLFELQTYSNLLYESWETDSVPSEGVIGPSFGW